MTEQHMLPMIVIKIPEVAPPKPTSFNPCSCVSYAKYRTGRTDEVWGTPNRMTAYDIEPYVGGLVLTTESRPGQNTGHVAVIASVSPEYIITDGANEGPEDNPCQVVRRTIPRSAPTLRGYQ